MSNWIKLRPFVFWLVLGIIVVSASLMAIQKTSMGKGLVTGKPGMNDYPAGKPGETTRLEKPFEDSPPFVSHSVTDFLISRESNDCLDCHLEGEEIVEEHIAIKVPPSHYKNEFSGEQTQDQVLGIRYSCLQCHVPQVEKEPPYSDVEK